MVDQRDSLAREIDEELRREQMLKLWERYGIHLIAAAVLVIAGIGGYKYYEHRRAIAAEAAGANLTLATREAGQNKKAEAQKTLEGLAATAPAGYAVIARLRLAAARARRGQDRRGRGRLRGHRQGKQRRSPARRVRAAAGGHVET